MYLIVIVLSSLFGACKKDSVSTDSNDYGNNPRTAVPAGMQGVWMYGNFSMTEYWSQNPADYLGNAFEYAIAFKLNANGTYEQYFTSKNVIGLSVIYHQSLSKGTVEINEATNTMVTHANTAHYKQTQNGQTKEDRDLEKSEMTIHINYKYELKTEENGTKAIYFKINGTGNALGFLKKF